MTTLVLRNTRRYLPGLLLMSAIQALAAPAKDAPAVAASIADATYATSDYVYPADSGYFNVKASPFKCSGDGISDDTNCIKAAMNAALRNRSTSGKHATVYFPAGTYLISDSLLWATYGDNNATVTAQIDPSGGCITNFTIVSGGSGYGPASSRLHGESNPGPSLWITGGGGSGASFYTQINNSTGAVTAVQEGFGDFGNVNCAGHGYTSTPEVTVLNWRAYLRFEGQNKANTTIKLTNNNPRFQNSNCSISVYGDAAPREYCRPMILVASERAPNSSGSGLEGYENDIWNLTINTGSGNPGAIAVDWVGSNRAAIKNVNIVSDDKKSKCGLSISRSASGSGNGPGYVKNVAISGFDYGIYANEAAAQVGITFEYIHLSDINKIGVFNKNMPNWFHYISANISTPVFVNDGTGKLLLVDGDFTGGSAGTIAVQAPATSAGGTVFLRNIRTSGYAAALATGSTNTAVPGQDISEFAAPAPISQFPGKTTSLNLPDIPNTPEYINNDFSKWASVARYGSACVPNSGKDATACIQAAMNSGKPVVYFPLGTYWASSTIHVPDSVRVILGMNSSLASAMAPGSSPVTDGKHRASYCTIQFDGDGPQPVEFRNFTFNQATQINTFCYNGAAPLVLADIIYAVNISNTARGTGTIYLENVAVPNASYHLAPAQHVYARQYDVESGTQVHVSTDGGIWWMLGFKSEGAGTLWDVSHAVFELLGSFSSGSGFSPNPAFIFQDSDFSLASVTAYATGWVTAISETRGDQTLELPTKRNGRYDFSYGLYTGRK